MGRRRKNGMSAQKQNVIGQIIQMYDVKTTADLQDALMNLPGGTIQSMYTTNAIGGLNSCYRRLNRGRKIFPGDTALEKAIWLATWEMTKKWTMPVKNRGQVYAQPSNNRLAQRFRQCEVC